MSRPFFCVVFNEYNPENFLHSTKKERLTLFRTDPPKLFVQLLGVTTFFKTAHSVLNQLFENRSVHTVDLPVAGAVTLVSVFGRVELVTYRNLQFAAVPFGILEDIEPVVVGEDTHFPTVEEVVSLEGEREPILEERFGDTCIDYVLVPGGAEILAEPFSLEAGING